MRSQATQWHHSDTVVTQARWDLGNISPKKAIKGFKKKKKRLLQSIHPIYIIKLEKLTSQTKSSAFRSNCSTASLRTTGKHMLQIYKCEDFVRKKGGRHPAHVRRSSWSLGHQHSTRKLAPRVLSFLILNFNWWILPKFNYCRKFLKILCDSNQSCLHVVSLQAHPYEDSALSCPPRPKKGPEGPGRVALYQSLYGEDLPDDEVQNTGNRLTAGFTSEMMEGVNQGTGGGDGEWVQKILERQKWQC